MKDTQLINFISAVLENTPEDWINLTTHRLDIYEEKLAKVQFLERFEALYKTNTTSKEALQALPTAFDYIRLGHPLSCVLEWAIAKLNDLNADQVISFSSQTTPILAILRKNVLDKKNTRIVHSGSLPQSFDNSIIKSVYGYNFDVLHIKEGEIIPHFEGSTIFISRKRNENTITNSNIDFYITVDDQLGSVILVNGEDNTSYISEIQHVRRRETIAMTPVNCHIAMQQLIGASLNEQNHDLAASKNLVLETIANVTGAHTQAVVGSSGLSIQYAIMMGLVQDAYDNHPGKAIKFIVPPNCYGGTNDQARRVAACIPQVEIVDLPVDGGYDMVAGIDSVLDSIATADAIPYIIAEIPTNPRVEVPDLEQLQEVLSKKRKTTSGVIAVDPVFILDQTFCPNVQFLADGELLSTVRAISYASGSKFPSGGKCTAGYCIGNKLAAGLMKKIGQHLNLCDNEATSLQYAILAEQLPSMIDRIAAAYTNTREFVNFITEKLPEAKINFVSEELARKGFTPSVFSLDLPTKGTTAEEKEAYKRDLNHKLINLMITKVPAESKYCVSYGQLKGCYWTIPATSTQGTTKEGDKDYIARVAVSPDLDLDKHKTVFEEFVESI